ncbi:metal ABC transporter solute-binding protein, Zn/Mn family, partial [Romboutsia sp.]|uniref:metal ABC transporter solute-binding protein, Zn/Mn family n=1 Tax=Romboutsia sp. TaxID=1965302 RepID=UPI002BA2A47E
MNVIGCSKENKNKVENKEDKIVVYTTVFPVYDFAKNIGKDKIDLNYIVPPGGEPHDYEITPKAMKDIQSAQLLIKNGLGIDNFADKIQSESKLNIVVATDGINAISYEDKLVHNHEHEGEEANENEKEHNHGEYDPHVWLDTDLAIKECENIKKALIKVDEKNKDYYENNYNEYTEKLKELKVKYDENLKSLKNNRLIVSHDAYGYLCKNYGIEQISITGISPNQEPSLSKISEISSFAKKNNIEYVLFDGLVNPKVAQTIANEANIKTAVLYSIDGLTKQDFDNNEDYISLMNKNLDTLKLALK